MIGSDIIRGYNDIIILSILMNKDSYGYDIAKKITEKSFNNYLIKEATLYASLNRLEKNKYISSYFGGETFGKKRTYFKITSSGKEFFRDKCKEWTITKKVINNFVKE